MSVSDMWDTSRKGVKFAAVGDTIEGVITAVETKQLATYDDQSVLETWKDGSPKLTPIITIKTDMQDDGDDDGMRSLFLRAGMFTAFQVALKDAYSAKPSDDQLVGATLKIRFKETVPASNPRFNDRKVYLCRLTPGSPVADGAWMGSPEPPAQEPRAEPEEEAW